MFLHTISKVFKNKDFRSVDLIRKKVIGYFRFFFYTGRTLCIKKIKVKKFHGVKKNIGGGHPTPPPPTSLFRVKSEHFTKHPIFILHPRSKYFSLILKKIKVKLRLIDC